jgi:hypothetical protein
VSWGARCPSRARRPRARRRGRGRLFEVVDGDAVRLTVRDTEWDNGERDLVACERHDSPQCLLADEGRTRNRLGVLFPAEARLIPVIVYVCTRVAPVAGDIRA